ncbi:MAG TPA: polysaccharide biosynthesis C-terminal domain-containing protein [Paracoccaceae bacterium]|nr:polysaccharide biosynthesis C-terminal domain-containing protein [Paracoccaceae bacterium]
MSGRRATVGLIGVKAANAVLGILTVVLFARWMGAGEYGLYVFAITLVQFVAVPLHFGLPTLLVRETAVLVQAGNLSLLRGLLRWSYGLILAGTAVVLALGLAALALFGGEGGIVGLTGNGPIVVMAALTVPLIALNKLTLGVLNGLRRTVASRVPDGLVRPGLVLLLGAVAMWVGWLDATSMVGFYLAAAFLAALVGLAMTQRALPREIGAAPATYAGRAWLTSLLPLTAIAAVQMLKNQTDIVMLGLLSADIAEVAQYKVAAQLATLPLILQTVANAILAPRIAAAHAAGNLSALNAQVTRVTRWVAGGTVAFLLPLVLFGNWLIPAVFGADYASAFIPLVLLALGIAFTSASGATTTLLNMCGLESRTARLATWSALANVVLNLALIPLLGAAGAALATAITTVAMQLGALHHCRKRLGFVPHVLGPMRPR